MTEDDKISGPMMMVGGLLWLGGICVLLWQSALWLKDGFWTFHTLGYLAPHPARTGWGHIDQVIHWLWLQPLWVVVAGSGALLMVLALFIEHRRRR